MSRSPRPWAKLPAVPHHGCGTRHHYPMGTPPTDPSSHPSVASLPSSLSGTSLWASVYFVLAVTRRLTHLGREGMDRQTDRRVQASPGCWGWCWPLAPYSHAQVSQGFSSKHKGFVRLVAQLEHTEDKGVAACAAVVTQGQPRAPSSHYRPHPNPALVLSLIPGTQ